MRNMFLSLLYFASFLIPGNIAADSSELYFPTATSEWKKTSPEKAGMNVKKMQKVIEYAKKQNSTGLIMLYEGRILAEQNWLTELNMKASYQYHLTETTSDGRAIEDVASVQKSIISFIAGVAREKGELDINRAVSNYIGTGWSLASLSQENEITVRHLLSMTSGLTTSLAFQAPAG